MLRLKYRSTSIVDVDAAKVQKELSIEFRDVVPKENGEDQLNG